MDGTQNIKYLEYNEDYSLSGDEIKNTELPYVSNIEVVSPISGDYAKDNIVKLKVDWSEEINTTEESAPQLKIKFGNGVERLTTLKEIGNNYIIYEYTISADDEGYLKFVSYTNGTVIDSESNNWQQTSIELSGHEIRVGTKAYVALKDKYYYNVQQAIDDCDSNVSEYTTIQLIKDDYYYGYSITINEDKKVEIDLNSNTIGIYFTEKGIINRGSLRIIDTSIEQKGTIKSSEYSSDVRSKAYGIYNESGGNVIINGGTIIISSIGYSFGIYNVDSGSVEVNKGTINSSAGRYGSYAVYNYSDGIIKINEGIITSTAYDASSYGIYNSNNGSLLINGGIIDSKSVDADGVAYGIYDGRGGKIEISGGIISSESPRQSYGINLTSTEATVYLTGGEWKGRTSGLYKNSLFTINSSGNIEKGKINIPANMHIAYKTENKYIVNYLEENNGIVELTLQGITEKYSSIQDALKNIPTDGTIGKIKMLASESLSHTLVITEGQNVEVDLNGKVIMVQNIGGTITNYGELRIIDTSEEKEGVIKSILYDRNGVDACGIYNKGDGNVEINSGNIEVNSIASIAYGIYNEASGIIRYNGGLIEIKTGATYSGFMTYGIYNYSNGIIEINGGTINSLSNYNGYNSSYGIYNKADGDIRINGGTICASCASYSSYGIYIASNEATAYLTNGEWKGEISGIYIPEGMSINNTGINEEAKANIPINRCIGYRIEEGYIVNFLEEKECVVELAIEETKIRYSSIQDAIYNISTDGTLGKIKLLTSENLGRTIKIKEGQNVEIDLNGKEIISHNIDKAINNEGFLRIVDSSTEQTGKIIAYSLYNTTNLSHKSISGIYNTGDANLEINAGIITSFSRREAYGIYNYSTGNVRINGGDIIAQARFDSYTVYNFSSGSIEINEGDIMSFTEVNYSYGIYNNSTGNIKINGGKINSGKYDMSNNNAGDYGIYNNSTGVVEINNGIITAGNSRNRAYGIYFRNTNSYTYFNGGKILGKTTSIYPENKNIELKNNTYIKKYKEKIIEMNYYVAEVDFVNSIKVINNGNVKYYDNLVTAMSTTVAPTDGSLTEITLLSDVDILSNITIANGQNILLNLNGYIIDITKYNSADVRKPFINNGIFEIMDSVGTGQINIESTGYDDYGIYNNNTTSQYKMYGGTLNVTSLGNTAYGIYNYYSANDGITIEGGNINVTAKQAENGVTSNKAYGIYNAYNSGNLNVTITGEDTSIVATSELNDSYGYYSTYADKLTIGTQDGLVSNASPNIVGGTNGIYKTSGTISMYDGAVTGPTGSSISKAIDTIEDETILYVLDNQDGTETTMLLKEVEDLIVVPEDMYFSQINDKQEMETIYLPVDASDVTIDYVIEDENVAQVRMENNKYMVVARGNGTTKITFTVTDKTGKSISADCSVTVDDVAPSNDAPSATSTATTVTITCNQTDENGIDTNSIMYAISSDNGVTWSEWTNRNVISGLEADTDYLVKTKVSDISGNETESLTTTAHTKLANNSTLTLEPDTVTKENVKVTITWNNTEGLPQYYKVGEGEWTLVSGETTEVTVTETNVTVYTKLVYDGTEDSNINYILVDNIDRLAPKGTISINEDEAYYDGKITLDIFATDDAIVSGDLLGGISYMYLTTENLAEAPADDDEKWIRWEGNNSAYPYMLSTEGTVTVYMYLKDKAGNVSDVIISDTVEYNPPVVVLFEDDVTIGEYDTINAAYTAARTNNTNPSIIRVYKSHTMTSQLTIASNKNIVLDLNGRTVSSALSTAISNSGTLEIADSLGNGVFTNKYASSSGRTIYNQKNLTISGGTIEGRNTTSGSYLIQTVYNYGSSAIINMTGGKVYATSTRTSASSSYYACGIYNYSTYTTKDSLVITGGTIEVDALNNCYGYGIYNANSGRTNILNADIIVNAEKSYAYGIYRSSSGRVTITSGTVTANSASGTAYGVYNYSSSNDIVIGINDNSVSTKSPVISGSTYGIYSSSGYKYYFYDGVIKGKENNSISCPVGYLITPQYYGVVKSLDDGIETSSLKFDNNAPTVESLIITTDTDVNTQTVTGINVNDIGTGVVAYLLTQTSTVPTQASTTWTKIETTNGPIDISNSVGKNGTWYFWVMDAAGNVSETKSVMAENIFVKVESATLNAVTVELGKTAMATLTLSPSGSEAKKITYTSSDETVAYVHPETGLINGLKLGTATLTATILNYDNTTITKTATITVVENIPQITVEPQDKTVTVGTTTEFMVEANGTNLEYQWYKVDGENVTAIDNETDKVFKSNIEGQANTVSTDTIIINSPSAGTLSFDYMVSSEVNDTFAVTVTDANGTTTAVNNISGEVDWTSYSADFTPNGDGQVIITLTYTKNDSVDGGLDYGAIRNLSWYYYVDLIAESTYENDDYYTFTTPDTSVYDTTTDKPWVKGTEDGETVYMSSNKGINNSASTATVMIKTAVAGTLSFDYAIYSEGQNWDYIIVKVYDANGEKIAVPQTGGTGQSGWKSCSVPVTPDEKEEVKLTLLYRKDSSGHTNPDRAAIKNLKFEASGYITKNSTFSTDDLFTVSSNNWSTSSYSGFNSSTLTIPGSMVTEPISGTKYYATVTNSAGTATSRQATLTVADEAIDAGAPLTKTAPTLTVEGQTITATCNQTAEGITETYYAISTDDVTFGEWQTSNTFTNLEQGKIYYVKTKIVTASGEQESVSSFAVVEVYMLDTATITLDTSSYTYDGTAKMPTPTVKYDGVILDKDTDYSVSYDKNIDAGTGYVIVTGMGKYTGSQEKAFTINPKEVAVVWSNTELGYNGSAQAPTATADSGVANETINLKVRGAQTTTGTGYMASVDTITSTVTGGRGKIANYTFTNTTVEFKIVLDISNSIKITFDEDIYEYTGEEIKPTVIVSATIAGNEITLTENTDYEVIYNNNINTGIATIVINGIGNYLGSKEAYFSIADTSKPSAPSLDARLTTYDGTTYTPGTLTNKTVVIELTSTDLNEIVAYEWSTSSNGGFSQKNIQLVDQKARIKFDTEMNQIIYFRSKDSSGNYSDVTSIELRIDKTSPTATISIDALKVINGEKVTNTNTVNINITATDNISQAGNMKVALINEVNYITNDLASIVNNLTWVNFNDTIEWNLTAGQGLRKVYIIVKDEAENHSIHLASINESIITFDANGGSLDDVVSREYTPNGMKYTIRSSAPSRAGYTFLGWSTNKNATTAMYTAGDTFTVNAPLTLYAVWKSNSGCCFVEGTQILYTLDGKTKAIEDFKAGDMVVSYNVETGENYIAEVQGLIINPIPCNMARVYLADGSMVDMTDYHPLYTKAGFHSITNKAGYDTLVVGDIVKTATGWSEIVEIELYVTEPMNVYNLAVKDYDEVIDDDTNDSYYADGILAHNAETCGSGSGTPI